MNEFKESLKVNHREEDILVLQTEKEQKQYEAYLEQRRRRTYNKFGKRPKAHIDKKWQDEIISDLEDEFNERNRGGYGR